MPGTASAFYPTRHRTRYGGGFAGSFVKNPMPDPFPSRRGDPPAPVAGRPTVLRWWQVCSGSLALFCGLTGCQTPSSSSAPAHPSANRGHRPSSARNASAGVTVAPQTNAPVRTDTRLSDAELEGLIRSRAAYGEGLVRLLKEDTAGMLDYFSRAYEADPENEALALEVARRQLARKEYPAALKLLERAARRPSAAPEVYSLLGLTHLQLGQAPEALAAYRQALAKQPDNPGAYAAFARLLLEQNQTGEVLTLLDQGMTKKPDEPGLIVQFAETLVLLRVKEPAQVNPTQARLTRWLDQAGAKEPTDPSVLLRLAELNKSAGRPAEAERFFKASKARAPRNPFASARLAEMYLKEGKLAEATEQLESLQRDEPTNPVPWYYLGLLAMERRDYPRAEELFSRSLSLDPEQEAALLDLAAAQLSQDHPDEVLRTLARAREKFAPSFRCEYLASLAQTRKKNHGAARESLLNAERIAATNNPALLDARFQFQLGLAASEIPEHRQEAEDRLQKALKLKPDLDEAQNALGYLWAEQGVKLPEAQKLIEAALKSEPDNPAYLDSLGWVLFKRGNPAAAVKPLARAVELMSKDPDATLLDHLAEVYAALGRWAEARERWAQAIKLGPNPALEKKLENARGK